MPTKQVIGGIYQNVEFLLCATLTEVGLKGKWNGIISDSWKYANLELN